MPQESRRIEATFLNFVSPTRVTSGSAVPLSHSAQPPQASPVQSPSQRPISFDLVKAPPVASSAAPASARPGSEPFQSVRSGPCESAAPTRSASSDVPSIPQSEQSLPSPATDGFLLDLPAVKAPGFTSHRNAANPGLALGLMKDIETLVVDWQQELRLIVRQIQDLYVEGPMIDGWLEADTSPMPSDTHLSHVSAAPPAQPWQIDIADPWIDETAEPMPASVIDPRSPHSEASSQPSGYKLCGRHDNGQRWFRSCPPSQVPAVSLAIARYQRLQQLATRRQWLETQLGQLSETLIGLHATLKQP